MIVITTLEQQNKIHDSCGKQIFKRGSSINYRDIFQPNLGPQNSHDFSLFRTLAIHSCRGDNEPKILEDQSYSPAKLSPGRGSQGSQDLWPVDWWYLDQGLTGPQWSNEQKSGLFRVCRGFYYPGIYVTVRIMINHCKDLIRISI